MLRQIRNDITALPGLFLDRVLAQGPLVLRNMDRTSRIPLLLVSKIHLQPRFAVLELAGWLKDRVMDTFKPALFPIQHKVSTTYGVLTAKRLVIQPE